MSEITDLPGEGVRSTATGSSEALARHWTALGLATGPADRDRAEHGLELAYRRAGLRPPVRVLWAASPAAGAELAASTAAGAGPCLRHALRDAPWARRRAELRSGLGAAGWSALWAATGGRSWPLLVDRVLAPLRVRLLAGLPAPARAAVLDAAPGQFDAAWMVAFAAGPAQVEPVGPAALAGPAGPAAPVEPAGPAAQVEPVARHGTHDRAGSDGLGELEGVAELARSCGWWWAYADVAVLTERPVSVTRDNIGRLHRADGPALVYPDGFGVHAWRGIPVPPDVAERLRDVTVAEITAESNVEVRRVMLEHYGYDRYPRDAGAARVAADDIGTLWRVGIPRDEPLVMVEVLNATPEPDGTHRTYWLRVPPGTRTPREGIAWTFGLTEAEYAPLAQT